MIEVASSCCWMAGIGRPYQPTRQPPWAEAAVWPAAMLYRRARTPGCYCSALRSSESGTTGSGRRLQIRSGEGELGRVGWWPV